MITKFYLIGVNQYTGFRGIATDWLSSYSNNRKQTIEVGQQISDKATCSVPEMSGLGPLFFLLYVNDIHKSSKKLRFNLLADDTNIFQIPLSW